MAWSRLLLLLSLLVLAGCPNGTRPPKPDSLLTDYGVAIRWNEFDDALDFERERFKQIQVTGYEVKDRDVAADGSVEQTVEIRLVNRNTQIERSVIDHQRWRYDPATKRLWLTSGLPDFSQR